MTTAPSPPPRSHPTDIFSGDLFVPWSVGSSFFAVLLGRSLLPRQVTDYKRRPIRESEDSTLTTAPFLVTLNLNLVLCPSVKFHGVIINTLLHWLQPALLRAGVFQVILLSSPVKHLHLTSEKRRGNAFSLVGRRVASFLC